VFQELPEKPDSLDYGRTALNHTIIIDGVIAGSWRKVRKKDRFAVRTKLFRPLDDAERDALSVAVDRCSAFLGMPGFANLN
jgi:hypothetical protein